MDMYYICTVIAGFCLGYAIGQYIGYNVCKALFQK